MPKADRSILSISNNRHYQDYSAIKVIFVIHHQRSKKLLDFYIVL